MTEFITKNLLLSARVLGAVMGEVCPQTHMQAGRLPWVVISMTAPPKKCGNSFFSELVYHIKNLIKKPDASQTPSAKKPPRASLRQLQQEQPTPHKEYCRLSAALT